MASYKGTFLGRHFLAWLEYGAGSGTQTWFGVNSPTTFIQSGIIGTVRG